MQIRPFEGDRFFMTTESGKEYFLDLSEFNGIGFCSCKDFQYRHLPILELQCYNGLTPLAGQCKHIRLLKEYLGGKTQKPPQEQREEE